MANGKFGQVRPPSPGEDLFFRKNPNIGGRADFNTNTIVLNPYSTLQPREIEAVRTNEYSRLYMRKNKLKPKFPLTAYQRKAFTPYGSPLERRETIIGRIISGDPSAGDVTKKQREFANKVIREIGSTEGF